MFNKYSNIAWPDKKAQLTKHDAFSLTGPLPVQCGGRRRPGNLADAPQDCSTSEDFSPRTVLTKTFVDVFNTYCSISQKAMPFLTLSTIYYSSMASTAPHADSWWSGHVEPDDVVNANIAGQARHLSPRSRVCEQEWHSKDIHSLIHSHTPMHTPKKTHAQTTTAKCSTHQTWCLHLLVLFLSSVLVGDFQDLWHLLHFRGLVA